MTKKRMGLICLFCLIEIFYKHLNVSHPVSVSGEPSEAGEISTGLQRVK